MNYKEEMEEKAFCVICGASYPYHMGMCFSQPNHFAYLSDALTILEKALKEKDDKIDKLDDEIEGLIASRDLHESNSRYFKEEMEREHAELILIKSQLEEARRENEDLWPAILMFKKFDNVETFSRKWEKLATKHNQMIEGLFTKYNK
jgi:chromosome segregation ATPase